MKSGKPREKVHRLHDLADDARELSLQAAEFAEIDDETTDIGYQIGILSVALSGTVEILAKHYSVEDAIELGEQAINDLTLVVNTLKATSEPQGRA